MRSRTTALLATAALLTGGGAALAHALPLAEPEADLVASVGPDFTITLSTAAGKPVTRLDPGTYTIRVEDRSEFHNFHLRGPGVDRATSVDLVGTETWTVTLVDGTYRFVCDPHAFQMRGTLTVGTPPAAPKRTQVVATVGPRLSIALTLNGRKVRALKPGPYTVVVRDRTRVHNFRLRGPGVSRRTTWRFLGTVRWNVTLRKGTYRYDSDRAPKRLRGSFVVR